MEKKIKDFLTKISNNDCVYSDEAIDLLEEDFKKEVLEMFECAFNQESFVNIIKENDKVNFVADCRYYEARAKFLNENWFEIDNILNILYKYMEEKENERN